MELKIYKNIDECGRLWNNFSPNRMLFDNWDFRLCFYNRDDNQPYFIAGKERGKIVGIIPLSFIKSSSQYTYFGGWYPERNTFFVGDKAKLSGLLEQCPYNTLIEGIAPVEKEYCNFIDDEYTYFVDLSKYNADFNQYFNSFNKKKQKNFKRELRNMPKCKVHYNRLKDFKRLVELNIRQFDEDSIYTNKSLKESIGKMIALANKKGMLQMISVEVNGKVEAVDVGILFGRWYHVITGSSNNQKIPNIGKLITVLDIKNAISKKARFVDFLASSGYWKNQWNFEKEMLFKFLK